MDEKEQSHQDYLAKAKYADAMAASFVDSHYRDCWLGIAEAYRRLATGQVFEDNPGLSKVPPPFAA